MLQVNHDELKSLITDYYSNKEALLIYGRFGIGKSDTLKSSAMELAKQKGKEFAEWNKMSDELRSKVIDNPENYFILIDIRLSEYDSSDIKGLPMFKNESEAIEFKTPLWALFMSKPNSDGILFFDEINLAPPLVMSSCYKIIYDRVINDTPISKDWGVFGAGNLDEDRAYTNHIAPPLKDRAGEIELLGANADSWTKWAVKNGIEPKVIGFINFKESNLYKVDFNDKQKFTTYRGWQRLSKLTKGITDFNKLELLSCSAIGEGVAKEYVAFCRISKDIDLPTIIANPSSLKNVSEISVKWFITTAIAEHYGSDKIKFAKIMEISTALDNLDSVELVAYLWKLCSALSSKFKKEFTTQVDDKLFNKYKHYLL